MKKLMVFVLSISMILVAPLSVYAQVTSSPTMQPSSSNITSRVEERKARLKLKLTAAETARISGRCKAAQAKLTAISETNKKASDLYSSKYESFIEKITVLQKKLTTEKTSTTAVTDLANKLSALQEQYTAFSDAATALNFAIQDASAIDCAKSPSDFKAALEDAREMAKTVKEACKNLEAQTVTVLTTLHELRDGKKD